VNSLSRFDIGSDTNMFLKVYTVAPALKSANENTAQPTSAASDSR
jgi:hypothetical protein